ncbi:MAG TPA: hypothetical protein VME17_18975 [Bryobacteraceae bacterium]|nr:hypothetical protein [Bryobacteraceae bacterium]
MNKRNLILSIAAGLLGGALSTYLRPLAVHAQSDPPQEIRAQRFTLVDSNGVALGSFCFDNAGRPQIVLRDRSGHEVWTAGGQDAANRAGNSSRFDYR